MLWQLHETCGVHPEPEGAPLPPYELSPHAAMEPSLASAAKARFLEFEFAGRSRGLVLTEAAVAESGYSCSVGQPYARPVALPAEPTDGAATLFRGLGLAAARDAIYVGGMLGVAPVAQPQVGAPRPARLCALASSLARRPC